MQENQETRFDIECTGANLNLAQPGTVEEMVAFASTYANGNKGKKHLAILLPFSATASYNDAEAQYRGQRVMRWIDAGGHLLTDLNFEYVRLQRLKYVLADKAQTDTVPHSVCQDAKHKVTFTHLCVVCVTDYQRHLQVLHRHRDVLPQGLMGGICLSYFGRKVVFPCLRKCEGIALQCPVFCSDCRYRQHCTALICCKNLMTSRSSTAMRNCTTQTCLTIFLWQTRWSACLGWTSQSWMCPLLHLLCPNLHPSRHLSRQVMQAFHCHADVLTANHVHDSLFESSSECCSQSLCGRWCDGQRNSLKHSW